MRTSENLAIVAGPKNTDAANSEDMKSNNINAENEARCEASARVCGDCTACCTIMGVAELNKANHEPCPYNCGYCAIYDSRPNTCRSWSCDWLLGLIEGDERQRPDKLGLMFNHEVLVGEPVRVAYEVWPGAGLESNNEFLLHKMSQTAPIILVECQTHKSEIITPDPAQRQHIRQLIQQQWLRDVYGQIVVNQYSPH